MTEKDIKKRIKERACLQEVTGGEIPEDMKKGIRNLPDRTRSLGRKLRMIRSLLRESLSPHLMFLDIITHITTIKTMAMIKLWNSGHLRACRVAPSKGRAPQTRT